MSFGGLLTDSHTFKAIQIDDVYIASFRYIKWNFLSNIFLCVSSRLPGIGGYPLLTPSEWFLISTNGTHFLYIGLKPTTAIMFVSEKNSMSHVSCHECKLPKSFQNILPFFPSPSKSIPPIPGVLVSTWLVLWNWIFSFICCFNMISVFEYQRWWSIVSNIYVVSN